MKIKTIGIKNFKSLVVAQANNFSENNIVFGYNNSGKSNLIQLLHLIFCRKTDFKEIIYEEEDGQKRIENRLTEGVSNFWQGKIVKAPFIFYRGDRSLIIGFNVIITINKEDASNFPDVMAGYFTGDNCDVEIIGQIVSDDYESSHLDLTQVKLNNKLIYTISKSGSPAYFETSSVADLQTENYGNNFLAIFNDCVLLIDSDRYFKNDLFEVNDKLTPGNFRDWMYNLYIHVESYPRFVELIGSFDQLKFTFAKKPQLESNLANYPLLKADVGFADENNKKEVMFSTNGSRLPLRNYGTGIQQILYILAKIYKTNSKILIVEEIELNLSPEYQNQFLTFLQLLINTNVINQVFFTSHSNYLVGHKDVKGFYCVDIDKDGKSTITSLSDGAAKAYFDAQYVPKA